MKTQFSQFLNLIPSTLVIVYVTCGSWFLVKEIFCSILPFTVLLTGVIVCLIHILRVPSPDINAVEKILGKDLLLDNTEGSYVMKTVAHRGAGLDAPENSLAAFNWCHTKGCDAIEFDITLARDGVPIVFHDKTLERMADSNLVVNDTAWDQLKSIDISVKHPYKERFANTNIPTLDEAVKKMLENGQRMFIDIKDNNLKMVPVIHKLYEKYPELVSRAVVSSFFPNIIYMVRRGNPNIVCGMAWRPYAFAYESFKYPEGASGPRGSTWYHHYFLTCCDFAHEWALSRITYYILGLSVILLHKDSLSAEAILKWQSKGVRVIAWSINSPVEKKHVAQNLKITYLTDTLTGESTVHSNPPS